MRFRKKPVEIDAWVIGSLVSTHNDLRMLPSHIAQGISVGFLKFVSNGIHITTLEGGMFGRLEDVLIMGVRGEFYPCKMDIFKETYERVEEWTSEKR